MIPNQLVGVPLNFRPMRDSVYGVMDSITGKKHADVEEGQEEEEEHGFTTRLIVTVSCLAVGLLAAKYIPGITLVLDLFGRDCFFLDSTHTYSRYDRS